MKELLGAFVNFGGQRGEVSSRVVNRADPTEVVTVRFWVAFERPLFDDERMLFEVEVVSSYCGDEVRVRSANGWMAGVAVFQYELEDGKRVLASNKLDWFLATFIRAACSEGRFLGRREYKEAVRRERESAEQMMREYEEDVA